MNLLNVCNFYCNKDGLKMFHNIKDILSIKYVLFNNNKPLVHFWGVSGKNYLHLVEKSVCIKYIYLYKPSVSKLLGKCFTNTGCDKRDLWQYFSLTFL